ncbi:N-6 DNA methylase [Streptomyces sp. NPDC058691]|uniref:methylation-associated defense system DNA methyltransferase MAD2 n=1 Tax=Streptomyces sp. NPDC058691 TaxID=3346601 RepID=UPI0036482035
MADEQLDIGIPLPERPMGQREAEGPKAKGSRSKGRLDAAHRLGDDETIDYISNEDVVKLTDAEKVRQRIAKALVHQYGINPKDMVRDYPLQVRNSETGRVSRRRASIAIFEPGKPKEPQYLRRIVVTKARPKNGRTVTKIRTYAQADEQVEELRELMIAAGPSCTLGMWTDDKDLYFVEREETRFEPRFHELPNWPSGDAEEFDATRDASSLAELRHADEYMLRFAFRRCHNFIHGNEGLPKDAAFWQFLYVLFAKIHDEQLVREKGRPPRFRVGLEDLADKSNVARRIRDLFEEVKKAYADQGLFDDRDRLNLSDSALAFITSELAPFSLYATPIDAKGVAYQELVGDNLRGDRGQYFTPTGAVKLMVNILDPKENETVFDPCCGTGGFLRETLYHLQEQWKPKNGTFTSQEYADILPPLRKKLAGYARKHIFGADFDPFLRRAAAMGVMMLTDIAGNVYQMDSIAFPDGHLPGNEEAKSVSQIQLGAVDVLMTNPPFGSDIPFSEAAVLSKYRQRMREYGGDWGVAWSYTRDKGALKKSGEATAVAPEELFVQRAIEWVRPGGRIGIVLPNGILSNPGPSHEAVRRLILQECWVMASIELPVETFIVEANVNILTTLLFLVRKTPEEKQAERFHGAEDYPVFMAVAEKVGVDRRGNPVYVRSPEGDVVTEEYEEQEILRIGGIEVPRTFKRKRPIIDNDLPKIAEEYHAFVGRHAHELPWQAGS